MDEPMKEHTSFEVGGPADVFVAPGTTDEFSQVIGHLRKTDTPFYVMGNGTNLLVGDKGYRGVIVETRQLAGIEIAGETLVAEAGAALKDVAQAAQAAGLGGMEFASGIPGSIGGAAVMNAGAYDGEMKDIIAALEVIDEQGQTRRLKVDECAYGYRESIVQKNPWYITKVTLKLKSGDGAAIQAKMDDLNERRRCKQPLEYPSAGSTFRRPPGYFAGKLIQDAGFRGYRRGGAQVSEKHSGFVINAGDATAEDVLGLIAEIQETIKKEVGVEMRPEVIFIGER